MVDGVCRCTDNYQGEYCEYAKEVIEIKNTTVNATVEMKMKIDNRNFTEDLKNKTSPTFKSFETDFKATMAEVYKDVKGYQDVEIHELIQGSIIVNYTVILEVLANTAADETVQSISQNLVQAVNNNSVCNSSCQGDNCGFCFNPTFTNVTNYGVGEVKTDLCRAFVGQELRDYYTPLVTSTGVVCITRCDKRAQDPYTCVHGRCTVTRSGPQCECSDQAAFWYQDDKCSSRISKIAVAVGVPVGVLMVVIIILTIFLVRAQRRNDELRQVRGRGVGGASFSSPSIPPRRIKLASRKERYYDEDESWSSMKGFAIRNPAAMSQGSVTYSSPYIDLERAEPWQKMQRPSFIRP
ncbi:PREDICTED: mucin-3B-like [Calidris pugnax]|uniref:mucin-3B-like n=1 Tax=Calidris pugnax TaxID=198806 RepID=UPI00071CA71F|nr:PREDICTED: mucin-3B-like [Calidris pugnax]